MKSLLKFNEGLLNRFLTYKTNRTASIQSKSVGIIYRLIQLFILSYFIGVELIHTKGYQQLDTVTSVISTKVKGQGYVLLNKSFDLKLNFNSYQNLMKINENKNLTYKIIDVVDYIIPAHEKDSIFILTNFIETIQTQGFCEEAMNKKKAICLTDLDCFKNKYNTDWNGNLFNKFEIFIYFKIKITKKVYQLVIVFHQKKIHL